MKISDYKRQHYDMDNLPPPKEREKRARELKALRDDVIENDITRTATAEIVDVLADLDAEIAFFDQPARPDNVPRMRGSRSLIDGTVYDPGGSGMTFQNARTGETMRALQHNERCHTGAPVDVGAALVAMVLGRRDDLAGVTTLAATGGSDTAGGYLISPELSASVIDLARSASVCMRAGAQTVKMETSELALARLASDPTGHWRAETGEVTASQPSFEKITLHAKTLAVLVPCSIELLEDSVNAGSVITTAIQNAIATEIDRVILTGDGAGAEPVGIRNHASVNTIGSVGLPANWANPSAATGDILAANYPHDVSELAWISHPAVAEIYDGVKDTTNQPLAMTPWVSQLKRFYTSALPSTEGGGAEHVGIVGDFREVLVGMRTDGVVVEVLSSGSATDSDSTTWNAASQLMRFIRCYIRLDVALMHPSWLTVSSGITLS
jgi:HK97 family phage major capsid protein